MDRQNTRQAFSAYYHPLDRTPDAELTSVNRGTPGGEYLRRFWHPVEFSHELTTVPKRIRILGEDLVLFRDKSQRVGLVMPHCPHRGASLEFGQIDECGLRCCYHGWLIDIDGRILETPAEAPSVRTKNVIMHGAYPVEEYMGLIFAYMGPPELKPPLPKYDMYDIPGNDYKVGGWTPNLRYEWPANWVQLKENAMDVPHTAFLHQIAGDAAFNEAFGILPETDYQTTPIGMVYIASRRVEDNVWVRMHDLIMPNIHVVTSLFEDGTQEKQYGPPYMISWTVPIDDTNLLQIGYLAENEEMKWTDDLIHMIHVGESDAFPYDQRQRTPGDYDAVTSQGPITGHNREHLVPTDKGVVMFRRLLRDGIRAVARGEDPREMDRSGEVIRTFSQNAVIKAPKPDTPEEELELLRSVGKRAFAGEFRPDLVRQDADA